MKILCFHPCRFTLTPLAHRKMAFGEQRLALHASATLALNNFFRHKDQIGSKPLHRWPDSRDTARGRTVHVQVALLPSEDVEVVRKFHSGLSRLSCQ